MNLLSKSKLGILAAITVMLIWSGWLVVSRWGVGGILTNVDLLLLRFGTATLAVSPLAMSYGYKRFKACFKPTTILAGLACGVPYLWLSFIGLREVQTAHVGVIVNGALPIFTLLLLYLLTRQVPHSMQVLGISCIVIANIVLGVEGDSISYFAYMILLCGSLFLAIYTVLVKQLHIKAEDIIIAAPIANFVVVLPIWLLSESKISVAPITEIVTQMLYQGVLVSLGMLWLMSFSLKHISAYTFSFVMALVPVCAALLSYFILREDLNLQTIFGLVLCTLGIFAFNALVIIKKLKVHYT